MVLEASPEDLKRILKNAPTKATPASESAFYKDLRYEFLNAHEGHSEHARRLTGDYDAADLADQHAVFDFGRVAEEHGARFVDAILPRYELAVRALPHLKQALRDDWVGTASDFIEQARLEYGGLPWSDGGGGMDMMLRFVEIRLHERIDHAIRGVVIPPKPKWHERWPVAYAVVLLAIGAALGSVADFVVTALTGS